MAIQVYLTTDWKWLRNLWTLSLLEVPQAMTEGYNWQLTLLQQLFLKLTVMGSTRSSTKGTESNKNQYLTWRGQLDTIRGTCTGDNKQPYLAADIQLVAFDVSKNVTGVQLPNFLAIKGLLQATIYLRNLRELLHFPTKWLLKPQT